MLETAISTSPRFAGRQLSGRFDPDSGRYSLSLDDAILAPDADDPQAFSVSDNSGLPVRIRLFNRKEGLSLVIEGMARSSVLEADSDSGPRQLTWPEKIWSGAPLVLVFGGGFIGGACGGAAAGVNWAIFRSNLGRPAAWAATGAISLVALGLYLGVALAVNQAINGGKAPGPVAVAAAEIPNVTIDNGSDEELTLMVDGKNKLSVAGGGFATLKLDAGNYEFSFVNGSGKTVDTIQTAVPKDQALLLNPLGLNRYNLCTLTYVKLPAVSGGGEAFGGALAEKSLCSDFGLLEQLPQTLNVTFFSGSSETVQRSKLVKVLPPKLSPVQALGLLQLDKESAPLIYRDASQSSLQTIALKALAAAPPSPAIRQALFKLLEECRYALPEELKVALKPYENDLTEVQLLSLATSSDQQRDSIRLWALPLALRRGLAPQLLQGLEKQEEKARLASLRLVQRDWHTREAGKDEKQLVHSLCLGLLPGANAELIGEMTHLMNQAQFPLTLDDDRSLRQAIETLDVASRSRLLDPWNQNLIRRQRDGKLAVEFAPVLLQLRRSDPKCRDAVFDAFLQQARYDLLLVEGQKLSDGEACRLLQKSWQEEAALTAKPEVVKALQDLAWKSLASTDQELRRQVGPWLAKFAAQNLAATLRQGFSVAAAMPEESQRQSIKNLLWENFFQKLNDIPLAEVPDLMALSHDPRWVKYGLERLLGAKTEPSRQIAALSAKWPDFDSLGRIALLKGLTHQKSPAFRTLLNLGLNDIDAGVRGQALEDALAGDDVAFPDAKTCSAVIAAQTEAKRRDQLQQQWDSRQISHWRGLVHQAASRQQAATALLQLALSSPSERSRRSALQQLPRLKEDDTALITQLKQVLAQEKDLETRRAAWNLLLQLDGVTGRSQGLVALKDPAPLIRELAFQQLCRRDLRQDPALVTELKNALSREADANTKTRMEANARRLPK